MNLDELYECKGLKNYSPEKNEILQFEYKLAKRLKNILNQPERLSEKDRKVCDSPNTPTKGSETSRND